MSNQVAFAFKWIFLSATNIQMIMFQRQPQYASQMHSQNRQPSWIHWMKPPCMEPPSSYVKVESHFRNDFLVSNCGNHRMWGMWNRDGVEWSRTERQQSRTTLSRGRQVGFWFHCWILAMSIVISCCVALRWHQLAWSNHKLDYCNVLFGIPPQW